ncbi:MAG: hypothetical protein IJ121_07845 [Eubacterium sp.]|nr:hypothetical protein [Eubacterium sp.]
MLIAKALIIFIAYIVTYFAYGLVFKKWTGYRENSLGIMIPAGMFLYSLLFFVFILAPKLHRVPLHVLSMVWLVIWAGSVVLIFILLRRMAGEVLKELGTFLKENPFNSILFLVFNLLQCGFVELYGRWSSSNNPSNYVAYVTTAVFTDELGTTHPVKGVLQHRFVAKMFTETYHDHSAVVAKIFHVHPLIEIRWVIPALFLVTGNLLVFMFAREIFEEKSKQWLFFAGYQAAVACTTGSYLFSSFYMYFRNYEGKTIIPTVLLPALFYVFWRLYRDPRDKHALLFGILCITGSFHFTGTTMYMIPVACLGLVPALVQKKQFWRVILNMVLLVLPCILYAAFYILIKKGMINLVIR